MVEILWKSNAPHLPVNDHELVELRLVDLGNTTAPRFLVREIHASWSAASQQVKWTGYEDEPCHNSEEARVRFDNRRTTNIEAGFRFTTVLS